MRPPEKEKFVKNLIILAILTLTVLFLLKFSRPTILRLYIETGIGTCQKIPVFCMAPSEQLINPHINKDYILQLIPYKTLKIKMYTPKGFAVVQERIKKVYYKSKKRTYGEPIMYLLFEEPNFFVTLFPQIQKQGVKDDYEFIRRTFYAKEKEVKTLTDVFFVIMKSIFVPNLGDEKNIKMAEFSISDKRGFINYNISGKDNYFDCNIFNKRGAFFKIYIKDKGAKLDLEKVLTIISTIRETR